MNTETRKAQIVLEHDSFWRPPQRRQLRRCFRGHEYSKNISFYPAKTSPVGLLIPIHPEAECFYARLATC